MYSLDFIQSILSSPTPENRDLIISLARYLNTIPLNAGNAAVFHKIVDTNMREVAEILFEKRRPEAFFATISPSREHILSSLKTLINYRPTELEKNILMACLGVIEKCYKTPSSGYSIYPLRIADIQHLSKYLIVDDIDVTILLTRILESICTAPQREHKVVSAEARKILDAFHDNHKNLTDVLPHNLVGK